MDAGQDIARRTLDAGLTVLGPEAARRAGPRLLAYVDLLAHWNRRFNLTGTRAPGDIVQRHVLDSLSVAPHLYGERVLDAGTGAGLPGLVLAITRPELCYTLLDSAGKKTRFCLQAVAELSLENVEVVRSRLEDFDPAQPFSCVVSRAFVSAPALAQSSRRLLLPGGAVLAMKGVYPKKELDELQAAGFAADVVPLAVPGLREARHLLIVRP
jgi:16S rRNA (guanine527-N7)-methyltransferase